MKIEEILKAFDKNEKEILIEPENLVMYFKAEII